VGNILQNGVKFTAPGGRVSVVLERADGRATIRVVDDGIGIAPEMLGRIFEPFTQADESLDRSRGGLGLGLALVKGFVEAHAGTVEARSAGLGRGAELVVTLPLAATAAGVARSMAAAPRPSPGGARLVLVVEDNADAAETLRLVIDLAGYEVAVAHDGRSGLEAARAFRPEVILCDIGLPEMDGYAVARALRADPSFAATALVALTGYGLASDHRRAIEAGFDLHLTKPAPVEDIEEALRTAAPRRRTAA
jgi:two-component system, chemotaxis family, CheB/CheR fusion protein